MSSLAKEQDGGEMCGTRFDKHDIAELPVTKTIPVKAIASNRAQFVQREFAVYLMSSIGLPERHPFMNDKMLGVVRVSLYEFNFFICLPSKTC